MHGLIPRQFIDELLTKTELVELVDAYVPLKKRGLSHLACCPFHQEKTPSFHVIPRKQFYHCFGCGASGNAISFIMNYLHQSFPQAIDTLAAKAGMQVPREDVPEKIKKSIPLHHLLQQLTEFYQQNLRTTGTHAIHYLKQRGVNGDIAKRYQIGYAANGWHTLEQAFPSHQPELLTTGMLIKNEDNKIYDRYRHRIMFPIHDRHGRIIGFGGRAIDPDQQPKYLNSPETILFQKGRELYGLYQVIQQQPTINAILVVEGYLDVIALAQHDIPYAVATLGTATSPYHIQLLSKYTQHILFCFDGDKAGKQAAWRALESALPYLDTGLNAHFIFLPEGHDPDSFVRAHGKTEFELQIAAATPLNQFFFNTLLTDIDINDLAGKSQLIHAAKPYLLKIAEGPYKTLLIEELARLTRIESHRIEQLMIENTAPILPTNIITPQPIQRTPSRIALALLIQNPTILTIEFPDLVTPTIPNTDHTLLSTLLKHLREHNPLNTATLIEHYRESPWFELMNQLASWDHQVPENDTKNEFLDTIQFINKKTQESEIRQLIDKSKQHTLNESERKTLQDMLQARHKPIVNNS